MATRKHQRIGIWIIAIVMTVGTLGSFAVMVLANSNRQSDSSRLQQLSDAYKAQMDAQSNELSTKYFPALNAFSTRPAAFDAASVTTLTTEDLVVGDGAEVKDGSTDHSIYYIGWNPAGKVFDQSIDSGKLKAPLPGTTSVIEGMSKGIVGMKVGGIREISIPAAQAYGATGSGADIPANTPIKFIVMVVPAVAQIQPSQELLKLYGQQQQQ